MYVHKIMPKRSPIPNKGTIFLSVDMKKKEKAFEQGINISLLLDAALERELDCESKEAFQVAMERQNKNMKDFIATTGLQGHYDNYKFSGGNKNVVAEESKSKNQQTFGVFEGI
jgi:post-segregation antitoxin (ccd killing protein)